MHKNIPFHHFLPLSLKFLPESFVLKDKNEFKGLIAIAPTKSRQNRMEIQKLFFEENSFADATELVQYVVSKYKAMGAVSIMVKVDDYLPNLLSMFVTKCGFSQISYEKLWRITKVPDSTFFLLEEIAVIVAIPQDTPVTIPLLLTFAILASLV